MLTIICLVISLGTLAFRKVEDWTWLFIGQVVKATAICVVVDFCVLVFAVMFLGIR